VGELEIDGDGGKLRIGPNDFFGGILFLTPLHNVMLLLRITLWDLKQ
jgi:hypothetical protein